MKSKMEITLLWSFLRGRAGNVTVHSAMLFGAIAMALSVLIAPVLQDVAETYAENNALGIDRVMTGSIEKSKQYTVRKSVLDK